jgi:hypothetical protein
MRNLLFVFSVLSISMTIHAQNQPPEAQISNGVITAKLYLPDTTTGYYRGTRFDWSGVIHSLTYQGHEYYGPWYTKTAPGIHDFVFDGPDIVAGPCSAIPGPVDEFLTEGKALGYDEAKAGGTFIKIGIGVLRKPDDSHYDHYRLYPVADPGKWSVHRKADSVEFTQEVADASSGYAYLYTKSVRLLPGKSEMEIAHSLKNTGRKTIHSSVYNHNFLVLKPLPIGPNFTITVPFQIQTSRPLDSHLAEIRGNRFHYKKALAGNETVSASFQGFGNKAADYRITIENEAAQAGVTITADRPLSREELWSIRSILAMEPFIDMTIEPGKSFSWKYHYAYFTTK